MVLMLVLGVLLLVGVVLTLWWGGTAYETWAPSPDDDDDGGGGGDGSGRADPDPAGPSRPSLSAALVRYGRGVAVALVGGFWAGALVTGPAVRLIMRLLAATAGDDAQGQITEAEEVVGAIDLDGTIGLYLFGGILPGLLSGGLYVVFRRWLPPGRLGGVAFGVLHLLVAATRVDPLRPDNPDFDLVGPGWLSVATFSVAAIGHGMAVVAIANRYSTRFPSTAGTRAERLRAIAPLSLPALLLVPGFFLLIPIAIGLAVALVTSQLPALARAVRSRAVLVGGRVALAVLAVALLPSTVIDLRDVIDRSRPAASSQGSAEVGHPVITKEQRP